jgi:hypothetical protein
MTEQEIRQQIENGTVDWYVVSKYSILSEDFIREFKDQVNWNHISNYQSLSEYFIREFNDKVNWFWISRYQNLTEDFIREFHDKMPSYCISVFQNLSEDFIREFKDSVCWHYISSRQKLSEDFIREFKYKLNWFFISFYQNLSEEFRKEFNIIVPEISWLYKSDEEKLEIVKSTGLYEIEGDYVIAYKSVKSDFSSLFKRGIYYHVGNVVSAHCDCNEEEENSFGLSTWTEEGALGYYNKGLLLKVRIPISKLGCLVHDKHKIRCFQLEVLEVVQK